MKNITVWLVGLAILSCARQEDPGNLQGIVRKDSLLKLFPILASKARDFEEIFSIDKVIQLETRKENPIGSYALLEVDTKGTLLVVDFQGRRAYLFDSTGAFLCAVGSKGKGPGEYEAPWASGFDQSGNIYVHDIVRKIANKYDRDGRFLSQLDLTKHFEKFSTDSHSNLFFFSSTGSDPKDATVYVYDSLGNLKTKFAPLPESYTSAGGSFGGGIAIDSAGRIYQITPYEYKVQVFSNDGEFLRSFGEPPSYFRPLSKPTQNPQSSPQQLGSFHSSWTHIWNLQLYENSILILITGDDGGGKFVRYLDLYDLAGNVIQTGLKFFLQASVCSRGPYFYVLLQDEPDKEGFVRNPKIIRYKLKEGA